MSLQVINSKRLHFYIAFARFHYKKIIVLYIYYNNYQYIVVIKNKIRECSHNNNNIHEDFDNSTGFELRVKRATNISNILTFAYPKQK